MRTGVIVQARMSSARLPGKVLLPLAGVPVLERTLRRVRLAALPDLAAVATSDAPSDDPVAALCAALGAPVHRGPLDDVAVRVLGAAEALGVDTIVRVSADSPFIDPAVIDRVVAAFREGDADIVTNVRPRTFPVGQSVEAFSREALTSALAAGPPLGQREHVTAIFYADPGSYRIENVSHEPSWSHVRLVIDTDEDYARMQALAEAADALPADVPWQELIHLR